MTQTYYDMYDRIYDNTHKEIGNFDSWLDESPIIDINDNVVGKIKKLLMI